MKTSVIVNTCSLGPRAEAVTGSTTSTPHAMRAYALQHFILPSYVAHVPEVIVVGEFRDGEGYTYIPSPSRYFSAVDALHQRQEAFEASSGDIIVHAHDDHFIDPASWSEFRWWTWDVWAFTRFRHEPEGVISCPNGFSDGYISGHAAAYRREVLEECPWEEVPKVHVWDIEHTKMIQAAEFRIVEDLNLVSWDVEVDV